MTENEIEEKLGSRYWRLNNLYKFIDKDGKLATFRLNHVQKELLRNVWYLNIILKSRQQGITTFICILFLDLCLFSENIHCGIVAHRLPDAQAFFDDKIRFAYDNLPQEIRERVKLLKDTSLRLVFSNGSKITVGVSLRSGTYQYLHVSELGKICAQFPKKALEIKTGALNTVKVGQFIFIESTAEGRSGDFYQYCESSRALLAEGRQLSKLEWRFHFFGWALDPTARMDPVGVTITQELHEYFRALEEEYGIVTDQWQRAWYAAKYAQQGPEMMWREFPATPEEAFRVAIRGAYYKEQMLRLRQQRPERFTVIPWVPNVPVDTAWDLGMRDMTCIVFRQKVGLENRIIDYYQNEGEGLAHYTKLLQSKPYTYGRHYLPHDINVRSLNDGVSREEKLYQLGLRNLITVERTQAIEDGIEEVRNFLLSCWFDREKCERLIAALDEYRKKWNETTGSYASQPLHNWASNPADAFRCLACGAASNEHNNDSSFKNRRNLNWRTV